MTCVRAHTPQIWYARLGETIVRHGLLLPVVFFVCLPLAASAATIYDNGAPDGVCSPVCPDLTSGIGHGIFTLVADTIVTDIRFWTLQFPAAYNGGTLTWRIFADNSGAEGALIASNTFKLSQTSLGQVSVSGTTLNEFENDFSVPNVTFSLTSPQSYFLDITDTSGKDGFGIFWASSGESSLAFQLMGSGNVFPDPPDPSAPEPSTVLLLAAGVPAYVAARRLGLLRQRRNAALPRA
jgi:hypothetical protein